MSLPAIIDSNTDEHRLVAMFSRGRSANTLEAYAGDLESFATWTGSGSPSAAVRDLLAGSHGDGNARLLDYQATMLEAGLASSTINRRIAAILSIVALGRQLGMTDWRPEIRGLKVVPYRDTAGPGLDGARALLAVARDQVRLKSKRDVALVRLLYDMALRRAEVASLDLEHVDLDARKLYILGKGFRERQPQTMPVETTKALREWLDMRATILRSGNQAVFTGLSGPKAKRLSRRGIGLIITTLGLRAGIKVTPHGLRHGSITAFLDATGDLRAAQRFGRHASANTTLKYDDNRSDIAGKAAQTVATILSGE